MRIPFRRNYFKWTVLVASLVPGVSQSIPPGTEGHRRAIYKAGEYKAVKVSLRRFPDRWEVKAL